MRDLIPANWSLAAPSAGILLLLTAGAALSWSQWRDAGRLLSLAAAACLLAVTFLPLDSWALRPLESRFAKPALPEKVDGIIVLGGAFDDDARDPGGMPSLNDAAERLTNFIRLSRLYPNAQLVFTGGSRVRPGERGEADAVKRLLSDLGVDVTRVMFERQSRNSYENAVFSQKLVQARPGEAWILVTSAAHMPRAVGTFRKIGWAVIPFPVGYKGSAGYTVNLAQHLKRFDDAVHEWIGLVTYRLEGRTDALFPAP